MIVKFDGIDGSGKTTLRDFIAHYYSRNLSVFVTKEYGNNLDTKHANLCSNQSLSEILRDIAITDGLRIDSVERKLFFFLMSRRTNRLALQEISETYELILVDRSSLSLLAYGSDIDTRIRMLYDLLISPIDLYNLIFWIDTPVSICFERIKKRNAEKGDLDAVEKNETFEYLSHARDQFNVLCLDNPKVFRLDGTLGLPDLAKVVIGQLDTVFNQGRNYT